MRLWALDPYRDWGDAVVSAARARGWAADRVARGEDAGEDGFGFLRLSMEPDILPVNRQDYATMASHLTMVQDQTQIDVYENKSVQFALWSDWMPDTWRFTDADAAQAFLLTAEYPLVSKADTGASSVNVRILETYAAASKHVRTVFEQGIPTGRGQVQRGYVLLQRCIRHRVTYRVNALGNARAIFFRYCYPDRMVAQTGNVEPCMALDDEMESLLEYADRFFAHAGTRWCAIDILKDGDQWKLLETSEGWPWPSPGRCNEGTVFRSKNRRWIEMMDVLLDELESGTWSSS